MGKKKVFVLKFWKVSLRKMEGKKEGEEEGIE